MRNISLSGAGLPLLARRTAVVPRRPTSGLADGSGQRRGRLLRKSLFIAGVAAALSLSLCMQAEASPLSAAFNFNGAGFSGSGVLTYEPNVAPADPNVNCGTTGQNVCRTDPAGAYAITGITGTFSDVADGISNAAITGLVPIAPANERDPLFDPRVPSSLSFTGTSAGAYSYDNLFFPLGNPLDCSLEPDSPISQTGTFLDVFGIAFTVAGGYTADLWGDGAFIGSPTLTYGVGVSQDGNTRLANTFVGVNAALAVPEPGSIPMFAAGLLLLVGFKGLGTWRRGRGSVS